jgi:dihydroorotase-like cyclic amidohydrolase
METYRITEDSVLSGSGWSPYIGSIGVGKVVKSVINGKTVYEREKDE